MNSTTSIAGRSIAFGLLAALCASPVAAHHSFAMFDRDRTITITGTVMAWEFTNPHAYLQLKAPDQAGNGAAKEWTLEAQGLNALIRKGFRKDSFHTGDKLVVTLHPLRSGASGGELVRTVSEDKTVREFFK